VALKKPELVSRLVLVNAAGLADPTGTLVNAARTLEAPTPENMKAFVARAYKKHEPVPERAWTAIVDSIRSRPTAKIVAALREADQLDSLAQGIRAPTLVLWGADDGIVPRAVGRGYARLIPKAKLELVPECGHIPQQECPAAVLTALFGAP
jgi:pimeloyl-ACP methyl ester carboxylesterase